MLDPDSMNPDPQHCPSLELWLCPYRRAPSPNLGDMTKKDRGNSMDPVLEVCR
jgi:hypothetical protein